MIRPRPARAFLLAAITLPMAAGPAAAAQAGESSQQTRPASQPIDVSDFFRLRGGLDNSRIRFLHDRKGRVAFIGGSITVTTGWRDLVSDLLRRTFPETEFDFINAGVGGTNSTFGAFRLENDVFLKGPVDLLFLEYAVNDAGEDNPDSRPLRAMEGIVRRARRLNPSIDIIMQYFADQGKMKALGGGRMPEIILLHEKVATQYNIPVLNLASEVARKLDAGEFKWEEFSRDSCHPTPTGHQLYANCMEAALAAAWAKPLQASAVMDRRTLDRPMDPLNYENGRFIPVESARVLQGWTRNHAWDTEKKCNYGGAVDVLMAEAPGATLELEWEGSLVGISAIAGMDAGILECAVDNDTPRTINLFDNYCSSFHRPVCRVLAEELPSGKHILRLRMASDKNPKSRGHAARILRFVAN